MSPSLFEAHNLSETTSLPSYQPTSQPTIVPTSDPTTNPTDSFSPTLYPTDIPTFAPTPIFTYVVNGGFEADAETVKSHGGILPRYLPTGWSDFRTVILLDYYIHSSLQQDNAGDVFLSIAGLNSGFISQNISSCVGIEITLSFMAASFDCSDCINMPFTVYAGKKVILSNSNTPKQWNQFVVYFNPPTDNFVLRFQTEGAGQLVLDNIDFNCKYCLRSYVYYYSNYSIYWV